MEDWDYNDNTLIESVRQAFNGTSLRPQPEWIRGVCPQCGDDIVSNCYYIAGKGYKIAWECWSSLGKESTCTYRKFL